MVKKRGWYLGGSTVIGQRSGWFTFTKPTDIEEIKKNRLVVVVTDEQKKRIREGVLSLRRERDRKEKEKKEIT